MGKPVLYVGTDKIVEKQKIDVQCLYGQVHCSNESILLPISRLILTALVCILDNPPFESDWEGQYEAELFQTTSEKV
jgi:hypothetical protein